MLGCFPQEQGVTPPKAVQRTGTNLCDVTALLEGIASRPGRMSAGRLPDPGCAAYHTHLLPRAQGAGRAPPLHQAGCSEGGSLRKQQRSSPGEVLASKPTNELHIQSSLRLTHPRMRADSSARNSIPRANRVSFPKPYPNPRQRESPFLCRLT